MFTKLFGLLIATIWWLWIVVASIAVCVLLGLAITHLLFSAHYLEGAVGFAFAGLIIGVVWAEKVRNKIGLDKYFGTLSGASTKDQSMKRENY